VDWTAKLARKAAGVEESGPEWGGGARREAWEEAGVALAHVELFLAQVSTVT